MILQKKVGHMRAPVEQYDRDGYGSLFSDLNKSALDLEEHVLRMTGKGIQYKPLRPEPKNLGAGVEWRGVQVNPGLFRSS